MSRTQRIIVVVAGAAVAARLFMIYQSDLETTLVQALAIAIFAAALFVVTMRRD